MINQSTREQIKKKIIETVGDLLAKSELDISKKEDNTLVTEIDLVVSNIFKEHLSPLVNFYSEEDHDKLEFPSFILDPIDGTRELIKRIPECAVSLGYLDDKGLGHGWGWIFNPFTGLEINCQDSFIHLEGRAEGKLQGMVSRSEWKRGLYAGYDELKLILIPKGSIAFKLALLATGAIDFVITKRPKSIWDIAAGSILCRKRGIHLYQQKQELNKLSEKRLDGPLLWCKPSDKDLLFDQFQF
ncbi:MAG: inositol monophosphatase family protein [Bacteriovoracaceae bacterium]